MALKKYNIIICFIILLYLVVVNSQRSGPTTDGGPKSSPEGAENCSKSTACISANDTLKICNAYIKFPDEFIEEGTLNGTYKPDTRSLAKCMCNQPYYDTLTTCIEGCQKEEFKVLPLDEYKKECSKEGIKFTQTMPPPSSALPPKVKYGLLAGLVALLLGLIAFFSYKYYKKRKIAIEHDNSASEYPKAGGYPPPQSQHHPIYPPPPSNPNLNTPPPQQTYYPPPPSNPNLNTPPPQSETYYPPPPSNPNLNTPPPQSETYYPPPPGQGGQSDSYYRGDF